MLKSNIYLEINDLNNDDENKLVVLSAKSQDWQKITKLCAEKTNLSAALGINPHFAKDHQIIDIYNLELEIDNNPPIAIGSCGLDYVKAEKESSQRFLFDEQISLAIKYHLPIIVTTNMSSEDIIDLTKNRKKTLVLIHSYSGNLIEAQKLIDAGCYMSVDAKLVKQDAYKLHDIVKLIPEKQLLIEKDDKHNVSEILTKIAKIKNIEVDELTSNVNRNANIFFNIK